MLEPISADSARLWKADLQKINGLGFNSVQTWVEWNVGEPREGEYRLENLDLLLRLGSGPEGDDSGVSRFCARMGGREVTRRTLRGTGWPTDFVPGSSRGFCIDNKNVHKAMLDLFRELARYADKSGIDAREAGGIGSGDYLRRHSNGRRGTILRDD
jgi:Glycosyl hydrolases family 35